MQEYGGLGFDTKNICDNNLRLLYYFSDKKKLINLDLFAKKFSSLMLEMQQDFFDFFLKSYSKDKIEEIDFLYFLCSSQFNSQIIIDENTIFNLLSNAFRMNYDLKIFSENNLFFNKIVSLLDGLLSSSSLDKKTVNKIENFLYLFFDFSQEETQYSEIKITFFTKIYAALSDDQKKYIRLLCLESIDILRLDCVNDCSMIERREEDSLLEFFEASDASWLNPVDSQERRVDSQKFEMVLGPLKWPDAQLEKWLKN